MGGYCHKRNFTLRYTDFDFKDDIKFSSILGLAQEAACSSADELGFGYEALKPRDLGFITVHTYCELLKPVCLGDELTVKTWPLPPRHVIFERDYEIENQRGEVVLKAASRWCLVDLKTFSLLQPEAMGQAHTDCPYNPEKALPSVSWQIPKLESDKPVMYKTMVGASRLDHYFHANNTLYADFFMDCFTAAELTRPVKSFQIAYLIQAKEGVELSFFRKDEGNVSICEARSEEGVHARFRLIFGE